MKATGIIRRMDDLGRIVVPKEIRKQMHIREGDRMEIFVDDNQQIVLRKHDISDSFEINLETAANTLNQKMKNSIFICNTEKVTAVSGKIGKDYLNKTLSDKMIDMLQERKVQSGDFIEILPSQQINTPYVVVPLNAMGDLYGAIIVIADKKNIETSDIIVLEMMAELIISHVGS